VARQYNEIKKSPAIFPGFSFFHNDVIYIPMRIFTLAELEQYDGQNGSPVYVAYKNKVYDVTASWHWKSGDHWHLHRAGRDLTDELDDAPHGEGHLERFPVVGVVEENTML
jgi:predicted heme/steroid binding protein